MNGELLGVLHFKQDKEVLKQLGFLKSGQMIPAPCTIQSNFSHSFVKVDPTTVQYPEVWTKESQAFKDTIKQLEITPLEVMIEKSEPLLQKIKERPTILFVSQENKEKGQMAMAVDKSKVETVTKWLTNQNIEFKQVAPQEVPLEERKGLAVFTLVSDSIPPQTLGTMLEKFGKVLDSTPNREYYQRINSLHDKPQSTAVVQKVAVAVSTVPDLAQPKEEAEEREAPEPLPNRIQSATTKAIENTATLTKPEVALPVNIGFQSADALGASPASPASKTPEASQIPRVPDTFPTPLADTVFHYEQSIVHSLRNWYSAANKLGKGEEYKNRIAEVATEFQSGQGLSDKALIAMNRDMEELRSINRLTQISQRVCDAMGQPGENGCTQVFGKTYDVSFNPSSKHLTVFQKDGDVILNIRQGKIETNKVSPDVIKNFEDTNAKLDTILSRKKAECREM